MVAFFSTNPLLGKILLIVLFFVLAWILHLLARRLSRRIVRFNFLTPKTHRPRPERRETMQGLVASVISSIGFFLAILASVGQFVQLDTLVWAVTLFSTAFGFGARAYISDLLAGVGFLFEDAFAVGEKVEILGVEGVVEAVRIRTTLIRAPSGKLFIMPNGEIRVVRNFSRGRFSTATIRMGEVDPGDLQSQFLRILQVAADVAGRIDDHGFPAAANQIGVVRKNGQVVLAKHEVSGFLLGLLNQLNIGRIITVRRSFCVTRQTDRPCRSGCK